MSDRVALDCAATELISNSDSECIFNEKIKIKFGIPHISNAHRIHLISPVFVAFLFLTDLSADMLEFNHSNYSNRIPISIEHYSNILNIRPSPIALFRYMFNVIANSIRGSIPIHSFAHTILVSVATRSGEHSI